MNKINLFNMSCEELLTGMGSKSVDLIYTDPPYEMKYKTNIPGDKTWNKTGKTNNRFDILHGDSGEIAWQQMFKEFYRVLKDDTYLFMHLNVPFLIKYGHLFEEIGFTYKGLVIWNKNFAIGGDLRSAMKRDWEPIIYVIKGNPQINPVMVNRNGKLEKRKRISEINDWVFSLKQSEKLGHPTQKPLEVAKQIIQLASNEDGLVLDPFAGSGTCALACQQLNRQNISVEIDKQFFSIMKKRLNKTTKGEIKCKEQLREISYKSCK